MVQVSYPGVYVQEVPSGVRTITGVSTSIAAFLGRASKGPIDKATRLLSYADYERSFGAPHLNSDLAHSVKLFFGNGGTDCYVIRLAPGATAASVTMATLDSVDVLVATAKVRGAWGNNVRLEIDYNTTAPDSTFNLTVIHEEGGEAVATETFTGLSMNPNSARFAPAFVSQSSALIDLALAAGLGDPTNAAELINTGTFPGYSAARRPLRNPLNNPAGATAGTDIRDALNSLHAAGQTSFQVSVNGSAPMTVNLFTNGALPNSVASLNDVQNELATRIQDELAALTPAPTVAVDVQTSVAGVGRLLTIQIINGSQASFTVTRAPSNDIAAALMLGVDQGGVEGTRWSNFRPAPTASVLAIYDVANQDDLSPLDALTSLAQNAITSIDISTTTVDVDTAPYDLVTTNSAHTWNMNATGDSASTGDNDGVREKLRIIANAITNHPDLAMRAQVWGYTLAIEATDGTLNNMPGSITSTPTVNAFDNAIVTNVRQYALGSASAGPFTTPSAAAIDGGAPDPAAYLGSEAQQTGMHALDPVDLFNLVIIPGDAEVTENDMVNGIWGPLSTYCAQNRAFLLVDPPPSWTDVNGRPEVKNDTSLVNALRASIVKDHSAVFYPRIKINANGLTRLIGPAGAIAGLMARTDATRGVWKAPAGIEAGIRNIIGLKVELTDLENGVLNKKGVNCLRLLPNGIVNWGARTLDGDDDFGSEWKYIPIRRLALMIEESLYRGTRWAVFEPNDEALWANLRMNIGAFMFSLFRQGAFQGSSPQDAYFVQCDASTTTQDDRNKGIVNIKVGFAPLKPAEFVVITIQQMAGQIQA